MSDDLASWLTTEIEARGLTYRKLAQRAGTTHTTVIDVVNRQRQPTYEFCVKISRALGVPLDDLLVLAGLRRPGPVAVEEEEDFLEIVRMQPPSVRHVLLAMLRGLARREPRALVGTNEARVSYELDAGLEAELLVEFRRLPREWQEALVDQVATYVRLANLPWARIIGEEEDEAEPEE